MKQDLSDVEHFISNELKKELDSKINNLKSQNKRQIYDELNVKNTNILSRNIENDKEVIKVEIISRYMEKRNILKFEKKLITKEIGLVRKCPGCGASISVNTSGKCDYCDSIFNWEDYDYILVELTIN